MLINCSDNHPDALVDSVRAYRANHGRHGGGEGLDALLPASLMEAGDKGRPSQRSALSTVQEGRGGGNSTGFRVQISGFPL